jgi:HK97 family phage portal protein
VKRKYTKSGKYSKKAGTITNASSYNSLMFTGERPVFEMSAKDLVIKNTGWAAICAQKLATIMSSIELKLYYASANGEELIVDTRSVNKDRQDILKKSVNGRNYVVKNADNIVEVEEHPLKKLLYSVNERMNYADFISMNTQYMETIGNAYNLIQFENETPVALYPLLGENIEIDIKDKIKGTINKYIYNVDNKKYNYTPNQILHFVNYVPGNNIFGRGSLEVCLAAVLRENYYDMYEYYLCKNFALPSFIANWKTHRRLTEKEKMDLMKQFNSRFGSVKNAGKPIITEAEALEIIKLESASLREMNFVNGRVENRRIIAAAYGIPEDLLTVEDANRASALTAISSFLQFTVFPKMNKLCEIINQNLTKYFDDSGNLFVYFENTIPTDPAQQASVLQMLTGSRILTINEARNTLGYKSIEEPEGPEMPEKEEVKPAVEEEVI